MNMKRRLNFFFVSPCHTDRVTKCDQNIYYEPISDIKRIWTFETANDDIMKMTHKLGFWSFTFLIEMYLSKAISSESKFVLMYSWCAE